jgi:hypothetical protein
MGIGTICPSTEASTGEVGQVLEYVLGVGVEDVRAVLVHQDAFLVVMVVGVAGNMVALIDDKHFFV